MASCKPIVLQAGIPSRAVLASPKDWAYLLTIAFCSTTSHAFIARAFQVESAAKGAAIGYLQVCLTATSLNQTSGNIPGGTA